MKHPGLNSFGSAVILIATGSFLQYHYNYKQTFWWEFLYAAPTIAGWISLGFAMLFALMPAKQPEVSPPATKVPGKSNPLNTILAVFVFLVWLTGMIANLVVVGMRADERVDKIIASTEASEADGQVIERLIRTDRTGSKYFAIIEYPTPEGLTRSRIRDDSGIYQPGQVVRVRFSNAYPDMCRITTTLSR